MSRRRTLFDKNEELPSGYTRCEYLESVNGDQFINLHFNVTILSECEIKIHIRNVGEVSAGCGIIGGNNSGWFFAGAYPNEGLTSLFCKNNRKNNTLYIPYSDEPHVFYISNGVQKIDGIAHESTKLNSFNPTGAINSSGYNGRTEFGLFRCNALYSSKRQEVQRVYYCKLIDNNILKHNLIPALNPQGKPCMYDTVTEKPFYNQGAGEFAYKIRSGGGIRNKLICFFRKTRRGGGLL